MAAQVSVIVPSYNRRAMLVEALASVRTQREVRFELIIVDDGSDDGTWNDLLRGESARQVERMPAGCELQLIRTARRGPAAARNRGVAQAHAPLIAFLDSDDLWMPNKLARQLAHLRSAPELRIAQCQEQWLRDGRRVNPGARHRKRAGNFFAASLLTCLISPSAVIMNSDLFRSAGGFDEAMTACEDYDLWLRILMDHPVGLLDEELVIRRAGHPGQLSATTPALDRFRIHSLAKMLRRSDLPLSYRREIVGVLSAKCAIFARGVHRRGRDNEASAYDEFAAAARASLETELAALDRLFPPLPAAAADGRAL